MAEGRGSECRVRRGHELGDALGHAVADALAQTTDPRAMLYEALLARGFLVSPTSEAEGAGAVAMRDPGDRAELERYFELRDRGGVTTIRVPAGADATALVHRLMTSGPRDMRMTALLDRRRSIWARFRAVRFGPRIDLRSLDVGVALLVRVLPIVVVPTAYSGHGVGKFHLRVDLDGPFARAWLRFLFEHELRHVLPAEDVACVRASLRHAATLELGPPARDLEPALAAFWRGQRIARLLLDRTRAEQVRRRRRAIVESFDAPGDPAPTADEVRARCVAMWGPRLWADERAAGAADDPYARWLDADLGPQQRVVRERPPLLGSCRVVPADPALAEALEKEHEAIEVGKWHAFTSRVASRDEVGIFVVDDAARADAARLVALPTAALDAPDPGALLVHLRDVRSAVTLHGTGVPEVVLDLAPARWSPSFESAFRTFSAELRDRPVEGVRWTWVTGT